MTRALAITGLLALTLTGVASAQQSPAARPTVRVAMPAVDAASQAYYAQARGFFKQAGINVEITTVSGGAAVAAAVASGAVDIGQSNLSSISSAHERGIPLVAIAGANLFSSKTHQSALVVAANSTFHDARDFNGKTIGVAGLKNITEIAFDKWMDVNGGNWSSVKFVEVPFSTMGEAVATGRVDGAMMTEPELGDSLGKKRVRTFASPMDAIASEFVVGVWFTTSTYAKAHPDIVRAYASAMAMAADWANRNHTESAKLLEAATGIPVKANAARIIFADRLDTKAMQPVIDASAKFGALKSSFKAEELLASDS